MEIEQLQKTIKDQQIVIDLLTAYNCVEDESTGNTYFFLRSTIKDLLQKRETLVLRQWVETLDKLEKYNIFLHEVSSHIVMDGVIKIEKVLLKIKVF